MHLSPLAMVNECNALICRYVTMVGSMDPKSATSHGRLRPPFNSSFGPHESIIQTGSFAVFVPPKDTERDRPWNVQCTKCVDFLLFLYHQETQTMECTKCVDFAVFVSPKDTDHGMYKMCRFFAVFVPPKDRDRHRPWNVQMCTFFAVIVP